MLARSVGIPARLTTGFVPGERDSLSGRFVVRERDAHAWAEIYFPGVGWQGFDPTASVPLAGAAKPGGSWLDVVRHNALAFGIAVGVLVLLFAVRTRRVRADPAAARADAPGGAPARSTRSRRWASKAGRARAPAETPREYAQVLADRLETPELERVGDTLDADAFSEHGAAENERDDADAVLRSLRP